MNEDPAAVRKKKQPSGCLVVLAGTFLGALIGAAIGYVTYEPCVPDPNEFLDCLFDEPEVDALLGAFFGLFIGAIAGLVALVPRTRQFKNWQDRA